MKLESGHTVLVSHLAHYYAICFYPKTKYVVVPLFAIIICDGLFSYIFFLYFFGCYTQLMQVVVCQVNTIEQRWSLIFLFAMAFYIIYWYGISLNYTSILQSRHREQIGRRKIYNRIIYIYTVRTILFSCIHIYTVFDPKVHNTMYIYTIYTVQFPLNKYLI